jgi:hypothetical protein
MKFAATSAAALLICAAHVLPAATLEKLSLDDMVAKSTEIVRGRVVSSAAGFRSPASRGGIIYTSYTIEVAERWKGSGGTRMSVAVPGGIAQGMQQTFPGAPGLASNTEYVFFLWTSRSGLTQIIGLSQGLMNLKADANGKITVSRSASTEPMVDTQGNPIRDQAFAMSLTEFRSTMSRYGLSGVER